jgi:hypothetical protein
VTKQPKRRKSLDERASDAGSQYCICMSGKNLGPCEECRCRNSDFATGYIAGYRAAKREKGK